MEMLLFFVLLYVVASFALYWIIRLAVRHAIQDTRPEERRVAPAPAVAATIRRQQATYGGPPPRTEPPE